MTCQKENNKTPTYTVGLIAVTVKREGLKPQRSGKVGFTNDKPILTNVL